MLTISNNEFNEMLKKQIIKLEDMTKEIKDSINPYTDSIINLTKDGNILDENEVINLNNKITPLYKPTIRTERAILKTKIDTLYRLLLEIEDAIITQEKYNQEKIEKEEINFQNTKFNVLLVKNKEIEREDI